MIYVAIVILLATLMIGVPVPISFMASAAWLLFFGGPEGAGYEASQLLPYAFSQINSVSLIAIALFIMGPIHIAVPVLANSTPQLGAAAFGTMLGAHGAGTLAGMVAKEDLDQGSIYPSLSRMREVSAAIATCVADVAFARGLAGVPKPADTAAFIRKNMYEPTYPKYA